VSALAPAHNAGDAVSLLAIASPYRILLAVAAFLMLAESAASLAVPWLAGMTVGAVLPSDGGVDIRWALLALMGLFAAQAFFKFGSVLVLSRTADRITTDLRMRLYDHLQALPLAFHQRRRMGDTLALLTSDVYVVSGYVSATATAAIPLLVTAAGAGLLMLRIRAELALLVLLLVPLFYVAVKVAGRRLRPLSLDLQEEEASAIALARENLDLLPAIKTFTREAHESARFRARLDRILRLSTRQQLVVAAFGPLVQFMAAAGIVLLFGLASIDLAEGRLAAGELVAFLLYAQLLSRPAAGLADLYGQTQTARGALVRLHRAMGEPTEPLPRDGVELPRLKGHIELRDVTFRYDERSPALDGVSLHIAGGETVALVGPNGAGKSTIAHLLMRLHRPERGMISIDGIDIATASLASLRAQVGVVPQHVLLFNASVRDNIAYGRAGADVAAIEAAARAAGAHEFIMGLPQGYETVIGDRGVRISGGQQQRVALARALLKDPPILILDEATSMFDPAAERDFLAACEHALRARTVIFITHRPASLAAADRVVRMSEGRIVRIEKGIERCS